MVKTTIILEDEVYKKLVQEALEKYSTTKNFPISLTKSLKRKK